MPVVFPILLTVMRLLAIILQLKNKAIIVFLFTYNIVILVEIAIRSSKVFYLDYSRIYHKSFRALTREPNVFRPQIPRTTRPVLIPQYNFRDPL